ncbi:hypothetical protein [Winogradskyella sp. PG-2]|uniref:hypothetical protein n=1 Tax=Winogradskyella sp. PG-2 TaxID=754409 RepID=UPI0004587DFD|nr:hypothetical protein [Winogradskyella sp. PG-2]BAO76726.1 hypothetical protein WPG_2496 [Winogradskyella sp. PG-2]
MSGHYFFFGILMIFLISMPIFLIWDWNKNREATLKELFKNYWKNNRVYLGIFLGFIISEFFIPLNTNHGFEFNTEREKLGIPELKDDWKIDEAQSKKSTTYWWKPEPRNGHFKKVIEYGVLNAKTETDYYQNKIKKELLHGLYLISEMKLSSILLRN